MFEVAPLVATCGCSWGHSEQKLTRYSSFTKEVACVKN
jgi:hypothetical protein